MPVHVVVRIDAAVVVGRRDRIPEAADAGEGVQAAQRRPDRVPERIVELTVAPVAQIHLAVAVEVGVEVLEQGAGGNTRSIAGHGCHDGSGREIQIQEGRDADLPGRPPGLARG